MNSGSDQQWLLDTGASHHITNDLSNLSLYSPYDGRDELHQTYGRVCLSQMLVRVIFLSLQKIPSF